MRRIRTIPFFILVLALGLVYLPSASPQEIQIYGCSHHLEVQSSTPGPCPKCAMALVAQPVKNEQVPLTEAYTCPMCLDVRAKTPGPCPKCAMALVPSFPSVTGEYELRLDCAPAAVKPNHKVQLRFTIFHPKTGERVKNFQVVHEQLLHLFIVSQDMSHFQHIHPTLQADGRFTIDTVLPQPGHYKIYADFYPTGGTPQVLMTHLATAGYRSDLFGAQAHLTPDAHLSQTVDGLKIDLTLDPVQPIAGKPLTLKYYLTDAQSGQPVRDLTPYLGAWGHTIILSEDQVDYVHSHPAEPVGGTANRAKPKGGPRVTFDALIPRPGRYRLWSQFERSGTLTTVSFTLQVHRLN